jgi:hypothetical protein
MRQSDPYTGRRQHGMAPPTSDPCRNGRRRIGEPFWIAPNTNRKRPRRLLLGQRDEVRW